jgi:hypothetical protein
MNSLLETKNTAGEIELEKYDNMYPIADSVVDGRKVLPNIDNTDSISASLYEYEILRGIRVLPMGDFHCTGKHYSVSGQKRIDALASQIKSSNSVSPLIVVIDNDGPYILEGSTRIEALYKIGAKSFPALVVIDKEEPDTSEGLISEVHFSDMYPKGFVEFYNKWEKRKNDTSLYVRFDGGKTTDILSKDSSKKLDHEDMMGVYAYPLKYVIDHPADIWYGHNSPILKIIKDKSRRKLILNDIGYGEALNLLRKAGVQSSYDEAEKHYPERSKGKNSIAKLFLSAIQMDFSNAESPPRKRFGVRPAYKKPTVRSGQEQTKLFLKMGVDAVEDKSKNIKDAIINDREPEQICWFTPISYEILETFVMSHKKRRPNVLFNPDRLKKKFAAGIATIMNDKIVNNDESNNFWTKNERLIQISATDASIRWRMNNLKVGQKPHRFVKKESPNVLTAKIFTERGDFSSELWASDLSTTLGMFKRKFEASSGIDNGKKYTKKIHDEKAEKDRLEYANQRGADENIRILAYWEVVERQYNTLANRMGLKEMPNGMTDEQKIDTYKMMTLQSDMRFIKRYKNANVDVLTGYGRMIQNIKDKGRMVSSLPTHALSDLMGYENLNEIKYTDFFKHLIYENTSANGLEYEYDDFFMENEKTEPVRDIEAVLDHLNLKYKHVEIPYLKNIYIITDDVVIEIDEEEKKYPITFWDKERFLYDGDFSDLEIFVEDTFNAEFWANPATLYHATKDENVEGIKRDGLEMTRGTGINNRGEKGVFTVSNVNLLRDGIYGKSIFQINTKLMKSEGITPLVKMEPLILEKMILEQIAHAIQYEYYGDNSDGQWEDTVIIGDRIDPKYLTLFKNEI